MLLNWCLIAGLEILLTGSDSGSVCEQSGLSVGSVSLSQPSVTVTSALPYVWSSGHQTAVQSSMQSHGGQRELKASSMIEDVRQSSSSVLTPSALPVSSAMIHRQSLIPGRRHRDTATDPLSSHCRSGSSGPCARTGLHTDDRQSSGTCQVTLQPAEPSAVESSHGGLRKPRTSAALELGNVHLRDLLSENDDGDDAEPNVNSTAAYYSHESPQEPQSTSCDDPPDSSTGSVRSSLPSNSILKQLLADSDSEEQNEVSASEPETTHSDSEPHLLLKVCQQL